MSLYGSDDSTANQTKASRAVMTDSNTKTIVFIDDTEAQLAENKARGLNAPGWWAYDTYTDMHGNTRHKAEQIVFICGPEANAQETLADDTYAADITSLISISVQPANATTYAPAGAVAVFSHNGVADGSRTPGTYTITDAAGSVAGTGADFTVVVAGDGTPTITLVSGGTGYADAETITIADASLGGGGGAAVVITVDTAATAAHTFSVTASSTGVGASLTYQWQKLETAAGSEWTDVSAATSATLALTSLTAAADNGDQYRVKINNSIGGVELVSDAATLTVLDRT